MSLLKSEHVVNDTVKQNQLSVSEKVDAVSQDAIKQEKHKVGEKTMAVSAQKAEQKSEAKVEVKEKSKKDQVNLEVVDDHKLAVKHTIALVKAQKLHQDLLQFNKLLINNKDDNTSAKTSQKAPEGDKLEVKATDAKSSDAQSVQPKESVKESTEAKAAVETQKEESSSEQKKEESDD